MGKVSAWVGITGCSKGSAVPGKNSNVITVVLGSDDTVI